MDRQREEDQGVRDSWDELEREQVAGLLTAPRPEKDSPAQSPNRVAVVCDAGLGKSTNMQWLESMVARGKGTSLLPILLRLDDGNKPHLEWIVEEYEKPGTLLERIQAELVHGSGSNLAAGGLVNLRDAGGIALLIDGLDHAVSHPNIVHYLGKLFSSILWKNCPIWISGRPYAFEQYWKELFADGWEFLKVNPLGEREIRQYMGLEAGGDWYEELAGARNLLAVPRLLKLVCGIVARAKLPATESKETRKTAVKDLGLHTPADIYHRAFFDKGTYGEIDTHGLLAQGLVGEAERIGLDPVENPNRQNLDHRLARIVELVGCVAFTMMGGNLVNGSPEPNTTGLPLAELQKAIQPRLIPSELGKRSEVQRDLDLVSHMNNHALDFLLFTNAREELWVFQDRTVQAFFAAYWLVNRGTSKDLTQVETWKENDGYDEFWQFAAELPDILIDPDRWLKVFGSCFDPPQLADEGPKTEWQRQMIYHSFEGMKRRSPDKITQWRQSFLDLPKGNPKQKRIHQEITGGFRVIQGGICPFGADSSESSPGKEIPVGSFSLQQYTVTNEWYEEFFPAHFKNRWSGKHPLTKKKWFGKENRGDDRCPVVNVSFYDAWCFAAWSGFRLPNEFEWEHACRAGSSDRCHFGNEEGDLKNYAWYGEDYGKGGTHPVGQLLPNANWLYDMHGNVWEWCDSLYELGASDRVLRGGGWSFDGGYCRSAFRNAYDPSVRNHHSGGFRLAAVPGVGAKSGR